MTEEPRDCEMHSGRSFRLDFWQNWQTCEPCADVRFVIAGRLALLGVTEEEIRRRYEGFRAVAQRGLPL